MLCLSLRLGHPQSRLGSTVKTVSASPSKKAICGHGQTRQTSAGYVKQATTLLTYCKGEIKTTSDRCGGNQEQSLIGKLLQPGALPSDSVVSLHFWTWSSVALAKPLVVGEAGLPPWGSTDGGMPGRGAADRAEGDVEPEGGGLQLAAPCPPRPRVATTRREAQPEGRMLAVEVVHPGWRGEKGYDYPKAAQTHAAGARPRGWGRL